MPDPESHDHARACVERAGLLASEGDVTEAASLYERALALTRRVLGPSHPEVAATLHNLAILRESMGRSDEARALWAEARTILEPSSSPRFSSSGYGPPSADNALSTPREG